ncbi:AsnC family transcriptional regulator [Sneathiella sp. DP05]|uniref:AsnC family transcriptional regulator n=1 Tax=Sneathiella litorea TaxID=2606216 RepID=A0A6L8W5Y8_9PROT|nr:AsnC family transcriptional regulator [Sneathiella litorea]
MDHFDRQILSELQIDSGKPILVIAERVNLSLSAYHRIQLDCLSKLPHVASMRSIFALRAIKL